MMVFLLFGLAFGSVFFPRTITQTSTQISTSLSTLTITHLYTMSPNVTATVITVDVYGVVATCTTVSGTRSIIYVYLVNGETTRVTTIYPPNLPHEYQVILTTASTESASNQTYVSQPDTC
jgi:hypothetical protein